MILPDIRREREKKEKRECLRGVFPVPGREKEIKREKEKEGESFIGQK